MNIFITILCIILNCMAWLYDHCKWALYIFYPGIWLGGNLMAWISGADNDNNKALSYFFGGAIGFVLWTGFLVALIVGILVLLGVSTL